MRGTQTLGKAPQGSERGPGVLAERGDSHETAQPHSGRLNNAVGESRQLCGSDSTATGVVGEIHLHKHVDFCLGIVARESSDQRLPIDRMNCLTVRSHLSRFFALQLTDKIPSGVEVCQFGHLGLRFLVSAFAEIAHPEGVKFTHETRRVKLGDDYAGNRREIARCRSGGIRDLFINLRKSLIKRHQDGHDCYFKKSGTSRSLSFSSSSKLRSIGVAGTMLGCDFHSVSELADTSSEPLLSEGTSGTT